MKEIPTNIPAILGGEQRSTRFQYRHSVRGAAYELGVPTSWIWSWLLAKRLKSQTWLRRVWVRLEDVQALFGDRKAVQAAFYATRNTAALTHQVLLTWRRAIKGTARGRTAAR